MTNRSLTVVDINWQEPKKVKYSNDRYELDDTDFSLKNDTGLYCIYGRHPVYGQNVLLYIGATKSSDSGERSFITRLSEHFAGRFWYHTNLAFALGVPEHQLEPETVYKIESILIAAHKPALNRHHIDCAMAGAEKYLVRNWGFPGALQSECSGEYWWQ